MAKGKPKMKEADGSGEHGCIPQPPAPPTNNFIPPRVVDCHGVTMEEFAPLLRSLANAYLTTPVLDSTGLNRRRTEAMPPASRDRHNPGSAVGLGRVPTLRVRNPIPSRPCATTDLDEVSNNRKV